VLFNAYSHLEQDEVHLGLLGRNELLKLIKTHSHLKEGVDEDEYFFTL
jgi:hypothetical protein